MIPVLCAVIYLLIMVCVHIKSKPANGYLRWMLLIINAIGLLFIYVLADGRNQILISGAWLLITYLMMVYWQCCKVKLSSIFIINGLISLLLFVPNHDVDGVFLNMSSPHVAVKYNVQSSTVETAPLPEGPSKRFFHADTKGPIKLEFPKPAFTQGLDSEKNYQLNIQPLGNTNIAIFELTYYEQIAFLPIHFRSIQLTDVDGIAINPMYQSTSRFYQGGLFVDGIMPNEPLWVRMDFPSKDKLSSLFNWKEHVNDSLISVGVWQLLWLLCNLIGFNRKKRVNHDA